MENIISIAMGQMLVEGGQVSANLQRAVEMISDAGKKGCDIIVLPECLDIGWTCPQAPFLAETIPGRSSDVLCTAAHLSGIYVVAGLTEKENERIYNSAILISPNGDILSKHRKINVLDIAQDIYSIGTSLSVTETDLGKIGINICADNFPDTHAFGHTLARMGANIILSPSSWAIPPDYSGDPNPCKIWEESYTSLAYLFNIPVIGVSNVGIIPAGVWQNYQCIGNSLAVSRKGKIIKTGDRTYTKQSLYTVHLETGSNKQKGTDITPMLEKKGFSFPKVK